jgi:hypothetical protein
MKRPFVLVACALALFAAIAGYAEYVPRATPQGQPPLVRVDAGGLERLREQFNRSSDRVRVLALLSPT